MSRLDDLYNEEYFSEIGNHLIRYLTNYIAASKKNEIPANRYSDPEKAYDFWSAFLQGNHSIQEYYEQVVERSIHVHNPYYLGHQVSTPAPIAAFGGLLSDLLNNGMAVYEMGGASNPLERLAIEMIAEAIGYDLSSGGFMTSGGTLANLTAMLTARSVVVEKDIWEEGSADLRLGIMVSNQAHYCIDRAARIMGLGADGIIKLPVDENFRVQTDRLNAAYHNAKSEGIKVFAIVASSCSTATGSYDDITAMAEFARENNIWLHVDGAHGGATVFSKKYRHFVEGINLADSVIIDCHKMMMTPTLCTAVIYKDRNHTLSTFRQKAEYLFDEDEQYDWWNSGKRTFECTKLMMSIKLMAIVNFAGKEVFAELVDRLYDLAYEYADIIQASEDFELAIQPQANIVCYRYKGSNELNRSIRQRILEEGKFYIVQTVLGGKVYLRSAVMNPMAKREHMETLINEIRMIASEIQVKN